MGDSDVRLIMDALGKIEINFERRLAIIEERLKHIPLCGNNCAQVKQPDYERRIKVLEDADAEHRKEHDENRRWIIRLMISNVVAPILVALAVVYLK